MKTVYRNQLILAHDCQLYKSFSNFKSSFVGKVAWKWLCWTPNIYITEISKDYKSGIFFSGVGKWKVLEY